MDTKPIQLHVQQRRPQRTFVWVAVLTAAVGGLVLASGAARGQQAELDNRSIAELLPETVVAFAEIPQPGQLLTQILEHPLRSHLEASPDYQLALANPQLTQARAVVTLVEIQMGSTWQKILEKGLAHGIAIAVDAKTEGVAVLGHASDPQLLEKFVQTFMKLGRDEAKRQGNPDPYQMGEYRGVKAYQLNKNARFAVLGPWFVVTNKGDLGKDIIDRYLDRSGHSLAENAKFREGHAFAGQEHAAWAYVDIEALRAAGAAKQLLGGQAENPAAELLLGGLLANLHRTPFAVAHFQLSDERAHLQFAAPHDPDWIGDTREFFFGPGSQGVAPALVNLPHTIAAVSAYRDISAMWLRAGDLFDKETNDQLAAADSNLATLFSGRDFGEDILGAIRPELQVVVVRQDFTDREVTPSIRLPAFALVADLKEPETMQRELRRIFQSLIGFINVISAMNGQPQLDLGETAGEGRRVVTASFIPEVDRKPGEEGQIQFNFSPTLAFVGERVVLSSTTPLAQQLVEHYSGTAAAPPAGANTAVHADLKELRAILEDNRRQLIAQNMLEKGQTREEAEKELAGLFSLLDAFHSFDLRFAVGPRMTLDVNLNYDTGSEE